MAAVVVTAVVTELLARLNTLLENIDAPCADLLVQQLSTRKPRMSSHSVGVLCSSSDPYLVVTHVAIDLCNQMEPALTMLVGAPQDDIQYGCFRVAVITVQLVYHIPELSESIWTNFGDFELMPEDAAQSLAEALPLDIVLVHPWHRKQILRKWGAMTVGGDVHTTNGCAC